MADGAASTLPRQGGGAFGPHPSRRLLAIAAVLVAAAAVAAGILLGGGSGTGGRHTTAASASKYGGYPSWLPDTKLPPANPVVPASPAHPALDTIEGTTVEARLAGGGSVMVTAVGPAFPAWVSAAAQSGHLNDGSPVPATFTVTLVVRHGAVPLHAAAFSILSAQGQLVHPAVTGPGGGPLPAELKAGQHLNLTLRTGLTEGDGALRWAPSGPRVIAAWLYQLELD